MPYATNGDVSLYYETHGEGFAETDTNSITFCGELGFGPWQWGWQHAALTGPYRTVTPATRGTGESDVPSGPYSVEAFATDLDAVLSDAGIRSTHLVGVGFGGMIALTAALDTDRIRNLALVGTTASGSGLTLDPLFADPNDPPALKSSLDSAFSQEFLDAQPNVVTQIAEWRAAEDADCEAWEAAREALCRFDLSDRLYEVTNEVLVLHGSEDVICPPERGERLADGLPRAEFETVEGAGHLANVEHSVAVNDRLLAFFGE